MNGKRPGAKFPATNVADERPWSGWDATGYFLEANGIRSMVGIRGSGPLVLGLAGSLVDKKTIWREGPTTQFTEQQLSLGTPERSLVGFLETVGATATNGLGFGRFWPSQVLGQLVVLNAPLFQALGLMDGQ